MTPRTFLLGALVAPSLVLASAGVEAVAANPGATVAAGLGAFLGTVVSHALAVRRHERACPARRRVED